MNDPIVERLRDQAGEIARPEHAGWADTMIAAAHEITSLRQIMKRVWDTIPAEYQGPAAEAHARALNDLGAALREETER